MSIADLYRAIKLAKRRPKVVAVSSDTWASLKKAGVIEMKAGHSLGLFRDSEKFPVLQGDICVIVNPALDAEKKAFQMPPDGDAPSAARQHAPPPPDKPERRKPSERRKAPRRRSVHLGLQERRKASDRRKGPRRGHKAGGTH